MKIVGMLQQSPATIEPSNSAGVQICFIADTGGGRATEAVTEAAE